MLDRMGALAGGRLDELAGMPTATRRCCATAPGAGRMRSPSTTTRPIGRWNGSRSANSGSPRCRIASGVLGWPARMPPAVKYALTYLFVQAEFGLCCPLSMTDSLARTLRSLASPELVARYLPA